MIGSVDAFRLIAMLMKYKNIKVIDPSFNNIDLIQIADIVVTVNSKAGAEGILLKKHVIVLGDSFYSESGLVHRIVEMSQLKSALQISSTASNISDEDIVNFFTQVWNSSYAGELYYSNEDNILSFTKSLLLAIK
jgi:archaellin